MKFISLFCLYLIVIVTILVIGALFEINASVLAWVILIGFGVVNALIINHYDSKHDD